MHAFNLQPVMFKHKRTESTDTALSDLTVTEHEPFLPITEEEEEPSPTKITPLPLGQLLILGWIRLAEPFAYFSVFPFLPSMVLRSRPALEKTQAGYYAGLVESCFALTQLFTIMYFGRLSDRVGRKPVLAIGLLGSAISQICFGLSSKSFPLIVLSRCLNGALNGNVSSIRSSIAELTDSTNQARAFTLLPLCGGIGASFGPILGSYLANRFEHIAFFREQPYFLPCFASACIPLSGFVFGLPFLKETLPPHLRKRSDSVASGNAARNVPFREMLTPQIKHILVNYSLLVVSSTSLLAITPLFTYTPLPLGLGFAQTETGLLLGVRGTFTIAVQLFAFPALERRFGSVRLTKILVPLYPFIFLLYPAALPLAIAGHKTFVWLGLVMSMILWACANMCFSANSVLVSNAAPSRSSLGSLNGLVQSCASMMRGITPALASVLYALSVDKQVLGGNLIWICLFLIGIGLCFGSLALREQEAAWRKESEHVDS